MAIERRLRDVELLGERCGRDLPPLRLLEHLGQGLEDLEPPFPFDARHGEILRTLRIGECDAEHQSGQLRDRFDAQIGERHAARVAAHPDG